MKNKVLAIVLALVTILSSMAIVTSASEGYDEPLVGGNNLFTPDEIMYPGEEGKKFHNAFVHPDVWNPIDGKYETWTGVNYERTTYKGVDCVKVAVDEGLTTGIMDFNYYQWNAEKYEPSLDASKYQWFKIKYAYNTEASAISYLKFFASKDVFPIAAGNLKSAFKTWDIVNGAGEWQESTVFLGDLIFEDGTMWGEDGIRQWRIQPFEGNETEGAAIYIAGFGFFESEEAANAWDYKTKAAGADDAAAKAAAEKAAAEKKAAEEAAAKAAAEKAAAEEAAAKAAAEKAAAEAAAAKAAEEAAAAAEAAAKADATEAEKAVAEAAAKAAEEAKAAAEAAAAADAAAKADAEAAAEAAAKAESVATAPKTGDYTVIAVLSAVIALVALAVVSKKRFSL